MKMRILFICRGNSARSQMAEAIINAQYSDKFSACSAGTDPVEKINPYAIITMKNIGIDISGNKPKSIDVYAGEEFDFIITLCSKGKEQCVKYSGKPILSHWDLPDPADFTGTEIDIMRKFVELLNYLNTRIRYITALSPEKLNKMASENRAIEICPAEEYIV